jgi:protein-S-isoprenylcysteine O-methyltransferase Ste14
MTTEEAMTARLPIQPRSLMYRATIFAFGVMAYLLGVVALVALILITLGVSPFTGGPLGTLPFGVALALDLLLLVGFALQHSAMARPSFKARWTRVVPVTAERSIYMFATAFTLLPLLWFWQPMPTVVWLAAAPMLRWLLIGMALAGWTYLLAASFAINHFELFGLQQVYQGLRNRRLTPSPFRVRWMYRFDRHPIMTGILIGLWVTPKMTVDRLLFAVGATAYIWIGVFFEERSLHRQLGLQYEEYCERVGSIVPTFRGRRAAPVTNSAD